MQIDKDYPSWGEDLDCLKKRDKDHDISKKILWVNPVVLLGVDVVVVVGIVVAGVDGVVVVVVEKDVDENYPSMNRWFEKELSNRYQKKMLDYNPYVKPEKEGKIQITEDKPSSWKLAVVVVVVVGRQRFLQQKENTDSRSKRIVVVVGVGVDYQEEEVEWMFLLLVVVIVDGNRISWM